VSKFVMQIYPYSLLTFFASHIIANW